jgi:DNA repair protein RecN (Recombination protein N)
MAGELAARVSEVAVLISDVAADLSSYASGIDVAPARLDWVQQRRAALAGLTRKYGPTLRDVLAWAKESASRLAELEAADTRIEAMRAERAELVGVLLSLADAISRERDEAAGRLGEGVSRELAALAMPHARLEVFVRPLAGSDPQSRLGPAGCDDVEMVLSAHPGAPARPLGKGASGGELSRVMLALEVVLADTVSMQTMVFDEVDAGIGGRAAVEVGRRLARLARTAQVVAVTHLPQVAAFAQRHYRVVKRDDGTVTTSGVQVLDENDRVQELSRMLAGIEGSTTAEAHARELLRLAGEDAGR